MQVDFLKKCFSDFIGKPRVISCYMEECGESSGFLMFNDVEIEL